jgi:hypothetical protein
LGYGDGDESTVISYGPNWRNKYTTTYFRRAFTIGNPSDYASLEISILRDDGAVIYLNGVEIARSNMPGGTIGYSTNAESSSKKSNNIYIDFSGIDPSFLVSGTNVLAVEIHLSRNNNRICGFDLELGSVLNPGQPSLLSQANSPSLSELLRENPVQYGIERIDDEFHFTVAISPGALASLENHSLIAEFSEDLKTWRLLDLLTREGDGDVAGRYVFPEPMRAQPVGFVRLRPINNRVDF